MAEEKDTALSLSWTKRREFYERKRWALAAVIAISIGGSFLGLFIAGWPGVIVGLLLSVVTYFLGPLAETKVREIEKGG